MSVIRDSALKNYNHLSRYSTIPTYYNPVDRARYHGTALQLSRNFTSFWTYVVKIGDTLDSIALRYYNTPLYWWIIADVNAMQDSLELKEGQILSIPDINEVVFVDSLY